MKGLRPSHALAALLTASLVLNLLGNSWGLPNTNAWHGDTIATETLRLMSGGFEGFSKYPFVHHLTLALVYSPYLAWQWASGGLDTSASSIMEAFADPVASMTTLLLMARVVSALLGAAIVLLVYRIGLTLSGRPAAALAGAALWAFSTEAVLFSHWSNVDVPMVFWFAVAFAVYVRYLQALRPRDGLLLGVLAAVAISTKEQIGGAFVLMGVGSVVLCGLRRRRAADEAAHAAPRWSGLLWGLIGLLLAYGLLSKLFVDPGGWAERMRDWMGAGTDATVWGGFPNTPAGHIALLRETWNDLCTAMGAPLAWIALGGTALALWRGGARAWWILLPLISYHVFTIGAIHFVYPRFLLPTIFLLSLLLCQGLAALPGRRAGLLAGVIVGGALLYSAARCVLMDSSFAEDPRYAVEDWLREGLAPGTHVEVYAYDHYLPRVEALGFSLERPAPEAMTIAGLKQRRPAAVLLVPTGWHRFSDDQTKAFGWLRKRSGYSRYRFDFPAYCATLGRNSLVSDLQPIEVLIAPD